MVNSAEVLRSAKTLLRAKKVVREDCPAMADTGRDTAPRSPQKRALEAEDDERRGSGGQVDVDGD